MRNMRRGTIAGLLAVVAVLLALNLAVNLPGQEAQAQGMGRPPQAVAMQLSSSFGMAVNVYRMFSDGTVEVNTAEQGPYDPKACPAIALVWCGWEAIPE